MTTTAIFIFMWDGERDEENQFFYSNISKIKTKIQET